MMVYAIRYDSKATHKNDRVVEYAVSVGRDEAVVLDGVEIGLPSASGTLVEKGGNAYVLALSRDVAYEVFLKHMREARKTFLKMAQTVLDDIGVAMDIQDGNHLVGSVERKIA